MKKTGTCHFILMVAFIASLFLIGCSEDNGPTGNSGSSSRVEGRVTNSDSHSSSAADENVENADVTLLMVESNGVLKTVSNNTVKTDKDGKFIVETNLNGVSGLIVSASKGNESWKAVLSSEVRNGITVYSQPLNKETTAEAEVYIEAESESDNSVNYAEVARYISSEAAAEIKGNKDKAKAAASAFKSEAEVQAKAFINSFFQIGSAKWNSFLNARTQAQATLERNLHFSENSASVNAAFEAYANSIMEAYAAAGVSAESYAKLAEISHRALINKAENSGSNLQFHLQKKAALVRAKIIQHAMEAKFAAADASSATINSVNNASIELSASIKAANSSNEIINAFDSYHSKIINNLTSAMGLHGSSVTAAEANIATYKAALKNSVNASITSETIIAAYIDFYQKVKTECQSKMAQAGEQKVNACADILILANMQF